MPSRDTAHTHLFVQPEPETSCRGPQIPALSMLCPCTCRHLLQLSRRQTQQKAEESLEPEPAKKRRRFHLLSAKCRLCHLSLSWQPRQTPLHGQGSKTLPQFPPVPNKCALSDSAQLYFKNSYRVCFSYAKWCMLRASEPPKLVVFSHHPLYAALPLCICSWRGPQVLKAEGPVIMPRVTRVGLMSTFRFNSHFRLQGNVQASRLQACRTVKHTSLNIIKAKASKVE